MVCCNYLFKIQKEGQSLEEYIDLRPLPLHILNILCMCILFFNVEFKSFSLRVKGSNDRDKG